jgi:hypothetical protein
MKKFWIARMVGFGILAAVVFTALTMYLWNWLVPMLFNGPVIEFWQALGLLVLSRILFGGFGKGHRGHWKRHQYWRNHWQEKMANMTPEERDELRKKWKARCGYWYEPDEEEKKTE